jgi:AraC-like DNA-binding protein
VRKNRLAQLFLMIFIACSIALYIKVDTTSSNIFSGNGFENDVFYETYHETVDSGYSKSEVSKLQSKDAIEFTYTLTNNKNILEPFSALFFYRKDSVNPFFNLTNYNSIAIDFSSFRGKRIPITFTLNYEGFTDKDKLLSNLPLTYLLHYDVEGFYSLALDDFEIPSWWLREHNLKKEDLTNIDFSRVNYIVIGSCQLLGRGVEDKMTIRKVVVHTNNSSIYTSFGITVFMLGAGLLIFSIIKSKKIVVPYSKVNIQDKYGDASSKVGAVVNYVADHYANPELSLNDIQLTVGISSREIGTIFKNEFGSSFKKYLNLVRLTEVKRLLVESGLSISVIAYKTGYSNVSHFNKVFKSEEGISPKDYRERAKK